MRIFLMTLAALLVAGSSGYYLLQGLRPAAQPVAAAAPSELAPPVPVFVPADALAAGTILLPEHLSRMPVEKDAVTPEMVVADDEGQKLLVGSVARHVLSAGVPIARSAVVQPGERGFLAAVLPRGKRAISIPIGEVAGVSGLVMPGDRVDIILTYSIPGAAIAAERDIRASETVLSNLRVLALDQRLQGAASAAANDPEARPIARTATLEVQPGEAEMLTLATQLGELSLVLNSVEDGGATEPEAVADLGAIAAAVAGSREAAPTRRTLTLDSEVTSLLRRETQSEGGDAAGAPPPLAERVTEVQIVRGIESRAQQFGGDPQGGSAIGGEAAAVASGTAAALGNLAAVAVPPN